MIVAWLLLMYGALAVWIGHTIGTKTARFSGLLAAHDLVLTMWKREIDRPVGSSRAAIRKKRVAMSVHGRLARALLREAKRESEAGR